MPRPGLDLSGIADHAGVDRTDDPRRPLIAVSRGDDEPRAMIALPERMADRALITPKYAVELALDLLELAEALLVAEDTGFARGADAVRGR